MSEVLSGIQSAELNRNPKLALALYLKASELGKLTDLDILNLGVIMFLVQDHGFFSDYGFSREEQDLCWGKLFDLMDTIGTSNEELKSESEFWKLYFRYVVEGKEDFICEAEQLLRYTDVPLIYLCSLKHHYCDEARLACLLEAFRSCSTERERYIFSVVSTAVKNMKRGGD